ncbi:MAG: DUF2480 family protein [Rhodothermales bacterium]|nr:DUF2480 family protein [Rhodothermales bacterium]MBO6778978.1 DUF2480 family protein [Rhodothermales bacterium]
MEPIVNRVAQSGIQVLDLAEVLGDPAVAVVDLVPFLYGGMILREKHFRDEVAAHDWHAYAGKHVGIVCTEDTIIPTWAYMLIASRLEGVAASVTVGNEVAVRREHTQRALARYDWSRHEDAIVVVKGCGTGSVPDSAFVQAMNRLQGMARKIMFGEPCSSVPLWRRPKS